MIENVTIFFGIVEDVNDPLQLGRLRVRIHNLHSKNPALIPTSALPWATVSTEVQNSAIDGLGWSPTGVVVGSDVWGFFLDDAKQQPFIVGAWHGYDEESGDHDVNSLARGKVAAALATVKDAFAAQNVGVQAASPAQDTPISEANLDNTSATILASGPANNSLAAQWNVSTSAASYLATVKLTDQQVSTLKTVSAGNTGKFNFFCYVLSVENRGNPAPSNAVSPAGASGPYQLMPATAKATGLDPSERGDFNKATVAVGKLYDELNSRYKGNRAAVYADYNGGPKFGKLVAAGQAISNSENRNYVAMAMYLEQKNQPAYLSGSPAAVPSPAPTETPVTGTAVSTDTSTKYDPKTWMSVAEKEVGTKEYTGTTNNNPRILEYHATTSLNASNDETPWCAAFTGWVLKQVGIQGTRSASARSYLNWGSELKEPRYGAVVVVSRGTSAYTGHVGFVARFDADTVWILGGNQKDSVNISAFKRSSVVGYRWPGPADSTEEQAEQAANPDWSEPTGGAQQPAPVTGTQDTPAVGDSNYPWNRVYQSRAGHIFEIDDTPGNARLHWYHKSGTYREISEEGTLVDKSVQDRYEITNFNYKGLVSGTLSLTVKGTAYYRFENKAVLHSDASMFLEGAERIQMNSPLVAISEQLAAPSASFDSLDVKEVIEGTCKNALWAAQAGSLGGAAQAVVNKQIQTAMDATVTAAAVSVQDRLNVTFGGAAPSATTARAGDVWVDTSSGSAVQKVYTEDGKWANDDNSSVQLAVSDEVVKGTATDPNAYQLPDSDTPVAVVVSPTEPTLTEKYLGKTGSLWVNKITGAVKEWAPVALTWATVAGVTAKVLSDDTKSVGGVAAGTVATKAITGYEKAVQALKALSGTTAALDGRVNTFYQPTAPDSTANPAFGDFWFDTSNDLKMYVYDTGADGQPYWKRDESDIGALLKSLNGLSSGKATTYLQVDDPKSNNSLNVGDIWYEPTTSLARRWDGGIWVLVKSSGDTIEGGTIKGTSLVTNANETAERVVVDTASNSTAYYGDQGDGKIVQLAKTGDSANTGAVQTLGTENSALKALVVKSSDVAVDAKGSISVDGPVKATGVMTSEMPIRSKIQTKGGSDTPAASLYAGHFLMFKEGAKFVPCYSNGVNWLKLSDDTIYI